MLFITRNFGDGGDIEGHVGNGGSLRHLRTPTGVTSVQADGDELRVIRDSFTGIPMPLNCRVVRWEGDFARFIAAHLS